MSWLDKFFPRALTVAANGSPLPPELTINFGSGFTAVDNAALGRTDLSVSALSVPTGTGVPHIVSGAYNSVASLIVNADVDPSAAIAYAKLALAGAILNGDLAGSIAYSKLVLTGSIVNADINASAGIQYGKLSLGNSVTGTDIFTGAAIAYSKLGGVSSETINPQSFKATVNAKCQPTYVEGKNVQTTDATTVQTLDSFTLASNTAVVWTATVIGIKSDSSAADSYSVVATFRNNAGTVSQVGTTTVSALQQDDATWVGPTMSFSGTTISLTTKGKAATTIQWGAVSTQVPVIP